MLSGVLRIAMTTFTASQISKNDGAAKCLANEVQFDGIMYCVWKSYLLRLTVIWVAITAAKRKYSSNECTKVSMRLL